MNDFELQEIEENLKLYDQEIKNLQDQSELPEKEKKEKINECNKILRKIRGSIAICKRRNQTIDNPIVKSANVKNLEKYEIELKKKEALQKEFSRPIKKVTAQNDKMETDIDPDNLKTTQDVLVTASKVQDASLAALQRTERMMIQTEEIGQATLQTIQGQTEILIEIDKEADTLQANINRAKKDVSYFFRQLSGDKCCIMLLVLVVFGIVALVMYMIYKKRYG
jgi:hypothetical protein